MNLPDPASWNRMAGAHTALPWCTTVRKSFSGPSQPAPGYSVSAAPTSSQFTKSRECRMGRPGKQLNDDAVIQ